MRRGIVGPPKNRARPRGIGVIQPIDLIAGDIRPQRRKALKGFVRGTIEGSRFIMNHPEQAAGVMHKILPDIEEDLLLEVIKRLNSTHVWGVNGGVKPEITEFTVNVPTEMGGLKQKLTADQVLDRSLVEEVVAEIGLYKG